MNKYRISGLQELGELVRRCRGARSLQTFSESIGVAKRTVDRLEKGLNTPRLETLQLFSDELGLEVEDMVAIAKGNKDEAITHRTLLEEGLNFCNLSSTKKIDLIVDLFSSLQGSAKTIALKKLHSNGV